MQQRRQQPAAGWVSTIVESHAKNHCECDDLLGVLEYWVLLCLFYDKDITHSKLDLHPGDTIIVICHVDLV
jgi:hypothetical protein